MKTIVLILLLMLSLPANSSGRSLHAQKQDLSTGAGQTINFERISIEQGLSQSSIQCILQDRKGFMWFGTADGLNKYDGYRFTVYKNNPDNPNSLSDNWVSSIYEDPDEVGRVLWIGTGNQGLNKLVLSKAEGSDREKEKFTPYKNNSDNPNSLSDNVVTSIYEDRSGVLWIGTWGGGLNKFDREKEKFTHYKNNPNNPKSLSGNHVFSIYEDRSGVLWIGTWGGGLNKLDLSKAEGSDREKEKFTHYKNDPNNPNSLSDNWVNSIYEDRSEMLWIGTAGGGLNRFDRKKGRITHYRERDGLPNDCIYGILEDDHGNLWLSTNNGLSKFNPQTKEFKNYDVRDGLQSNEYNGHAYYKSAVSGEMFFGGINGFNAFHPDSVKDNPYIPPVVITAFARYNTDDVAGKPIAEKGISETQEIELSYKDNIFTFEFAALSYRNTFKNQYVYTLEGFNENWIQLGTKHDVTFTNLDPGKYTLRVKGSNNDGVWNETGASVKIIITPPYWQTWWFRGLIAAAVIGFLVGLYNYRVSKLLEIERTRNRIARDLHDEVGSSLSSIALMSELMQEEPGLVEKTKRELQQIGATALNVVETMDDLVWTINPKYDKLENLLLRMKEFAGEMLAPKQISYSFHGPEQDVFQPLNMNFRHHLLLIYKEILHNIIKHAQARHVDISITKTDGLLTLKLADDGKGFDPSAVRNGNGLKNMQARAAELNGRIEIASQNGHGTVVTLSVKIP
ncbi:MAG: two-component regulator propeller domain-containing protein [bacterium]